jgi:hypothetical protein
LNIPARRENTDQMIDFNCNVLVHFIRVSSVAQTAFDFGSQKIRARRNEAEGIRGHNRYFMQPG